MRRPSTISALVLLVLGASLWLSLTVSTGSSLGAAGLANCPRGIPAQKCNPSPDQVKSSTSVPVQPIPVPPPFFPSPTQERCGSSFLSATDSASLQQEFGQIECFMFSGGETWVIVGTGLAPGATEPIAGNMIAVDRCSSADTKCLDPNEAHAFSSFSVYYPPDAASSPLEVEQTFGGRLLDVSDAYCGQYAFDISTGEWYPFSMANVSAIMNGVGGSAPVQTPASVTGSEALQAPSPPPVVSSSCS
jgi:hypothetical protein